MTKAEDKAAAAANTGGLPNLLGDPAIDHAVDPAVDQATETASQDSMSTQLRKPKDWEPLSTTVPAAEFAFVKTAYEVEDKIWEVVVGFKSENDAKKFHDAIAADRVMLMNISAANLLAMQLVK